MDINSMLKGIDCSCGRNHQCDIEAIFIENGAISRLDELCIGSHEILIVADENTYKAAGNKVADTLCDKNIKTVIFSGETILIPDEVAISTVRTQMSGVDLIIGIGSGVIQDLCKYVSFFDKVPYIIVATAPSMDGYASNGAAMILNGMKETVSAGLPRAIIADTSVLKNAPSDMIKAGYGDIVGKYSALCDWKLSHVANGEYFCDYIYDTTYQMITDTLAVADGLNNRDENSIKILTEALMVVGIMMSFAGSSRPASGSEHHLSHFFEITGIVHSEPYFPHGIDVAYSTVVTAAIREHILKCDFPDELYRPERNEYTEKMLRIYGNVAKGCISLQDRVGNYTANRMPVYVGKEDEIRAVLSEMPSAVEIVRMLSVVGLNMSDFDSMYSIDKVNDAILYAKDLKDRYSVLWLYYDMYGDNSLFGDNKVIE